MPEGRLYTVGGKVQAGDGVYLARRADAELLRLCRAHELAFVLHTRQIGKSSLLAHVASELEAGGARVVVFDFTGIGTKVTAEEWYLGLVQEIADQAGVEEDVLAWWDGLGRLGNTQRLRRFFTDVLLRSVAGDVFVFLDEIDSTVPLEFTDDFFAGIRELYQARDREPELRRLTFVFAGSSSPDDLMRDPDRTPFNLGVRVDLQDFTLDEAAPLAAGLSDDPEEGRRVLGWILGWTGGHPNLTQIACVAAAAAGARTEEGVAAVIAERFFGARADEERNLGYVTEMLTTRADRLGRGDVLGAYRRILVGGRVRDERRSQVITHLKLSGVVQAVDGWLAVRNRIYARVFDKRWVDEHLPVNWRKVAARAWAVVLVISLPTAIFALWQWRRAVVTGRERDQRYQQSVAANEARDAALDKEALQRKAAEEARAAAENAKITAERERDEAARARVAEAEARGKADEANETLTQKNAELNVSLAKVSAQRTSLVNQLSTGLVCETQLKAAERDLAACRAGQPGGKK